eukprot:TRINITY_DN5770_c0_g2_i1.p1 TRINITY_DN5770_c0_g2~~TRINITY_DN5770_c0_g2_i1.p1  ORF type:complete len:842 (+),score=97.59 TRINITY_DN5770_c0_g2_i1:23-2548(+)
MCASMGRLSQRLYRLLVFFLHGADALDSAEVHPLTLQFLGFKRDALASVFDRQRRQGILHAQIVTQPLLVPTVILGVLIKISGLQSQTDIERSVLALCLITIPLVLAFYVQCIRGGPSTMHFYINHIIVFGVAFFGSALLDDHSGRLIANHFRKQDMIGASDAGNVYSWVLSIGGIGWLAGYSLIYPIHPLCLSMCVFVHISLYAFPILALEELHVRAQLAPQIFLVASVDAFIILGRVRAEFKEKLLTVNVEMVRRAKRLEQCERKTVTCLMKHAFNAHMWLGDDANLVLGANLGIGENPQHCLSEIRGMWPTAPERSGNGPLYLQELFVSSIEKDRFKNAIDMLTRHDNDVEEEMDEERLHLLSTTLRIFEASRMQTVERDVDIFVVLRPALKQDEATLSSQCFLLGFRFGNIVRSVEDVTSDAYLKVPEESTSLQEVEGVANEQHEHWTGQISPAGDRELVGTQHERTTRQISPAGDKEFVGSELGSQKSIPRSLISIPRSATATAMLVDTVRLQMMEPSQALELLEGLGREEHWLIRPNQVDFTPDQELGRGGFGVVTLGKYLGTPAAIKRPFVRSDDNKSLILQPEFVNELRILRWIRHPNITCFYGAVLNHDSSTVTVALVLEFVDGPTMESYIKDLFSKGADASLWRIHKILEGTCQALRYLHGGMTEIIHGDLKPQNIMIAFTGLDAKPQAKLLDMGLASKIETGAVTKGRSARWSAPEVISRNGTPTRASDVFSFAYVIYFCLSGKMPWAGTTKQQLEADVQQRHASLEFDARDVRTEARLDVLEPMLDMIPRNRPRMWEVQRRLDDLALLEGGNYCERSSTCDVNQRHISL